MDLKSDPHYHLEYFFRYADGYQTFIICNYLFCQTTFVKFDYLSPQGKRYYTKPLWQFPPPLHFTYHTFVLFCDNNLHIHSEQIKSIRFALIYYRYAANFVVVVNIEQSCT